MIPTGYSTLSEQMAPAETPPVPSPARTPVTNLTFQLNESIEPNGRISLKIAPILRSNENPPPAPTAESNRKRREHTEESKTPSKAKVRRRTYQPFPSASLFHKYFDTFYPVNSLVSYLDDVGTRVQGKIKGFNLDASGTPHVVIREKLYNFNSIDVPNLKRGTDVMLFDGSSLYHFHARVIEVTSTTDKIWVGKTCIKFINKAYIMENLDKSVEFLLENKSNQMYRLIPFIKEDKNKVVNALNQVWAEFHGIKD